MFELIEVVPEGEPIFSEKIVTCPQTLPNPKKNTRAERILKRSLPEIERLLELFVKFGVRIITVILLTKVS